MFRLQQAPIALDTCLTWAPFPLSFGKPFFRVKILSFWNAPSGNLEDTRSLCWYRNTKRPIERMFCTGDPGKISWHRSHKQEPRKNCWYPKYFTCIRSGWTVSPVVFLQWKIGHWDLSGFSNQVEVVWMVALQGAVSLESFHVRGPSLVQPHHPHGLWLPQCGIDKNFAK